MLERRLVNRHTLENFADRQSLCAAKKSIHTDVSMTTPATASSLVRIDVELQFPAVRQRPLIEPASLDVLETLDERLRNALTGHLESRIEKIRGKIRRHPARR